MSEPEFPVRQIVITLSLALYEQLAARAAHDRLAVEALAAEQLAEVARYGSPGELHAAAHLAAQVADRLSERWAERQQQIIQLRTDLDQISMQLGEVAKGV